MPTSLANSILTAPLVVAVAQAATGKDINLEYAFPRNAYSIELCETVRMLGLEVDAYEQIFDTITSVPKEVEVRNASFGLWDFKKQSNPHRNTGHQSSDSVAFAFLGKLLYQDLS